MAEIDIVAITEAHLEGFHATLDVVARERAYLTFLQAPPIEDMRAFVRKMMVAGEVQLVAVDGLAVVGWCDVLQVAREPLRHGGVLGIGLLPAWRGRGVGGQLMRRAIAAARERGLTRIELSVRHDNERAIALYRKLGFAEEGRKRNAMRVDGVYYDLIVMALLGEAEQAG